jgi:hypothetical protein
LNDASFEAKKTTKDKVWLNFDIIDKSNVVGGYELKASSCFCFDWELLGCNFTNT